MIRYYCSGFDINNAFGHGLGDMFKSELKDTKSIVYIPAVKEKVEKAKEKYISIFTEHFKNVGIKFEQVNLITPELSSEQAKKVIKNASFIIIMGGNPFHLKDMCKELDILDELKNYQGIMLGYSAGAMLMSKYIIIVPCSEEYPDFHIEAGLNLDNISIYPHNNIDSEIYPEYIDVEGEVTRKDDLMKVSEEYGEFYLLQDNNNDISIIKSNNGNIEYYIENNGKIWKVMKDNIILENINQKNKQR